MAITISRSTRRMRMCLLVAVPVMAFGAIVVAVAQTQTQTYTCAAGFTDEIVAPIPLTSLQTIANPVIPRDPVTGAPIIRADLVDYVANLNAAIRLGKALFWDMQAGSDNRTACATCHFQAGQDGRARNQMNPGPLAQWAPGFGPNLPLWQGAYPFTVPNVRDNDNIAGSQGVRKSTFQGISRKGVEITASVPDPVFSINGQNVRQVTGRNAPSVINAVFNHRNFFDGRAQAEYNGVNPFGDRDTSARVWYVGILGPTQIDIHLQNASLASQAVGPALNATEMSAAGRTFPDLGRKLLLLKPLGLQKVDPTDSVLGAYADPVAGLTVSYGTLIQQAFKSKWWNTTKSVKVNGVAYTMTEANMSLFWGLSIMLYEATLVSDQSPMDRYLSYRTTGGAPDPAPLDEVVARLQADMPGLTRDDILQGLALFELPLPPAPAPNGLGCMACHVGAELTSAAVRNLTAGAEAADIHFVNGGFDQRMERMFLQIPPVPIGTDTVTFDPTTYAITASNSTTPQVLPAPVGVGTYDAGYYNIGVRPTADNPGLDGVDPFGNSFAIVKLLQALTDPSYIKVPGNALSCGTAVINNASGFPLLSGPLHKTEPVFVAGSYKVPQLRNVELNGPYFHNGGKSTLAQVVEFYDDGGDFQNPTLAPAMMRLGLTATQRRNLVAFLLALTDDRVRLQRAPFDHPQLFVANGDNPAGTDDLVEIPAVGAAGASTALQRFLNLNPFNP